MNSPQRMRLTQYLAVLHHCLRCQLGTGLGPKYLLQDVSKLLILSNFFNFNRNKVSSLMTIKKIAASSTHKKSLLSHLLDFQGVQFFNLKIKW